MEVQKLGEVIASEKRSKEQLQKQLDEERDKLFDSLQRLSSVNANFDQKVSIWLRDKSCLESRIILLDQDLQQSHRQLSDMDIARTVKEASQHGY